MSAPKKRRRGVHTESSIQPLPGVRLHPDGGGWQVRLSPFPSRGGFPDVELANEYATELRRRRRQGIFVPPEPNLLSYTLLREAAEGHLSRLKRVGGRHRRPYSDAGLKDARKAARPWLGESSRPAKRHGRTITPPPATDERGVPFAETPLVALRVDLIETYLELRYVDTPRAAVGEYQSLQAILIRARRRGEQFDRRLLEMEPPRRRKTKRKGPMLEQLRFLAAHAPEAHQRIFLLGATLGGRIMELLQSEDAWLNLDVPTLTIPAWACKERVEKTIYLLPEEVALFREQQLVRSAATRRGRDGTLLLFPRTRGTAWRHHSGFYNRVVTPTRRKAAEAWRQEHDLPLDAPTPFEWLLRDVHGKLKLGDDGEPVMTGFAPHDLRRSAATLMRELGLSPELAAARLGHKDAGHLLLTVYADMREERLRAELDAIADEGGIDARLARRNRPSD
jgi:hypothetical protein